MLEYSFGQLDAANAIRAAVRQAIASGRRTADIASPGCEQVGTVGMGKVIAAEIAG
jgi:3-isopropylmalate dehydrogenase